MPVYEYKCQKCKNSFEQLRSMKDMDALAVCPSCGSEETRRQLSVFGVKKSNGNNSQMTGQAPPPSCGGG